MVLFWNRTSLICDVCSLPQGMIHMRFMWMLVLFLLGLLREESWKILLRIRLRMLLLLLIGFIVLFHLKNASWRGFMMSFELFLFLYFYSCNKWQGPRTQRKGPVMNVMFLFLFLFSF